MSLWASLYVVEQLLRTKIMAKKQKKALNPGQQEISEVLNKSEIFFDKYKKQIITVIVALLVVVIGVMLWRNYSANRNEKASTSLAKCQELFMTQQYDKALKGDSLGTPGLIQLANDFSSTKAGNLANLYAGLSYAKLEKWEEAVKYLDKFNTKDDLVVSPLAVMAMGDAYANVKQLDKAVDLFKKAAKMADSASEDGVSNSISPMALQKAGIILIDQKKNDEALTLFKEIKEKYVQSPVQSEVDKYIEYLTK